MKSKIIEWTDLAIEDLNSIHNYICKDSLNHANSFIDELIKYVDELYEFPKRGRIIPQIKKEYYREIFVGNYKIMYKIEENYIYIMAIINMSMDFNLKMLQKKIDKKIS
jgi:plasmid stabilization system protein ParE